MEPSDIMREALQEKKHTDCVFLVGLKDGEKKEVHAMKAIMTSFSPFFEQKVGHPLVTDEPIDIEYDPVIFQHVVDFTHCHSLQTKISCSEVVDLACAADAFTVQGLKIHCKNYLSEECTVDDFWPVLGRIMSHHIEDTVAPSVFKILEEDAYKCFEHPEFLKASQDTLAYIVKNAKLGKFAEVELIKYCKEWAARQEDKRMAMRSLLPHLRLLTVKFEELSIIHDVLEDKEIVALAKYHFTKELPTDLPPTINPSTDRRTGIKGYLVYVEDLPDNLDEEDVAGIFSHTGNLMHFQVSERRTAELFYKAERDAITAVKCFHNRCIGTVVEPLIKVEFIGLDNPKSSMGSLV